MGKFRKLLQIDKIEKSEEYSKILRKLFLKIFSTSTRFAHLCAHYIEKELKNIHLEQKSWLCRSAKVGDYLRE